MKNPCTKPCREFAVENGLCHCYESGVEREMAPSTDKTELTKADHWRLPIMAFIAICIVIGLYFFGCA